MSPMRMSTQSGLLVDAAQNSVIMYGVEEASAETLISKTTLRMWAKNGTIPAVRVGSGKTGKILINRQGLLNFLKTATIPNNSPPDEQSTVKGIRSVGSEVWKRG